MGRAPLLIAGMLMLPACSLLFDARDRAQGYAPDAGVVASKDSGADGGGAGRDSGPPEAGPAMPKIVSLSSNLADPVVHDTAFVRWTTFGATRVVVRAGAQLIYESSTPETVADGSALLEMETPGDWLFEADDGSMVASMLLYVVSAEAREAPPEISALSLDPAIGPIGTSLPLPVHLVWSTSGATMVELISVPGSRRAVAALGDEYPVLGGSTTMVLMAQSAGGSMVSRAAAFRLLLPEREPNDTMDTAQVLRADSVLGDIRPGNVDWYSIELGPEERARLYFAGSDCTTAPALTSRGLMQDPGADACGVWAPPPWDPPAAVSHSLPLHLASAATTSYQLMVERIPAYLGNGYLEGSEACDDGNGVSSDGCDSRGQLEPGYTYTSSTLASGPPTPDGAAAVTLQPYRGADGVYGLVPFATAVRVMGRRYGAALVHATGLITFSPRTLDHARAAPRFFPDPTFPFAAVGAGAAKWEDSGFAPVSFEYDEDRVHWTAIEIPKLLTAAGEGLTARVAFSAEGDIDLTVIPVASGTGTVRPLLAAGVQDAAGHLGIGPGWCLHGCPLSPVVGPPVGMKTRLLRGR